jgi:hypothetical protein
MTQELRDARSADEMRDALKDHHPVFAFLLGVGPLDGVWFSDPRPLEKGAFWWRKHLRAALSTKQEGECGAGAAAFDALEAMGFGGDKVDEKIGWLGSYPKPESADHFKCEFCYAEHLDCTLIEHAPDCAVPLARAAVAAKKEPL